MKSVKLGGFLAVRHGLFYIVNVLLAAFLAITISVANGHSADLTNPETYKINESLGDLLMAENFQLGLSCEEAVVRYSLDVVRPIKNSAAIISSSRLGLDRDKKDDPGFFRGRCDGGQLRYVDKVVSSQDGILDRGEIFGKFIKTYGEPDVGSASVNFLRYYITYNGRYADFKFTLRQVNNRTVEIYELEDMNSEIQ